MKKKLALVIFSTFIFCSCSKNEIGCYDQQLKEDMEDQFCTTDCPGVKGCDGKTYCNECEANKQGISVP